MEIRTTVKRGLPCRARVTYYQSSRCNCWGHPDRQEPDDLQELEFELLPLGSDKPADWLKQAASEKDIFRISRELLDALNQEEFE